MIIYHITKEYKMSDYEKEPEPRKPRHWWIGRIQAGEPECYTMAGYDVVEYPVTGYTHVIEVIE